MLFYATLLLTSFLLTLIILGIKNLIVFAFRKAFGRGREDVRMRATAHLANRAVGTDLNMTTPAWGGRAGHAAPAALAKTHPAMPNPNTPWGWPGSNNDTNDSHPKSATSKQATLNDYLARKYQERKSASDWRHNGSRPVRDDRSALSGQAYKPSQDAISRYGIDEDDDKPWGW